MGPYHFSTENMEWLFTRLSKLGARWASAFKSKCIYAYFWHYVWILPSIAFCWHLQISNRTFNFVHFAQRWKVSEALSSYQKRRELSEGGGNTSKLTNFASTMGNRVMLPHNFTLYRMTSNKGSNIWRHTKQQLHIEPAWKKEQDIWHSDRWLLRVRLSSNIT